jgi:hypothetical protein
MFYKLLGMAVWNGGKLYLRRRYGRTYVPKPLLAVAAVAIVGAIAAAAAAAQRNGTDE